MEAVEESIRKACQDGTIPGAILLAQSQDGTLDYAKAIGVKDLETKAPLSLNTPLAIASCTKLLTTISILQLFQAGRLHPTTDIAQYLPELAELKILGGFDEQGKPTFRERKAPITVRHLLTHSFGGCYGGMSPTLMKYYSNRPPVGTVTKMAGIPLIAEPDEAWTYSHGLDWAGLLIHRVTDDDLDTYMRKNLWKPLGLFNNEIGFWPSRHPKLLAEKASLTIRRRPEISVESLRTDPVNGHSLEAFGGHGLYATMPAYMKILRSIAEPKDERLLAKKWKAEMFEPHLSRQSEESLNAVLNNPLLNQQFVSDLSADRVRYSWGYGGLLSLNAIEGWRGKGTLLWSGFHNLLHYIDPEAGLCVLFGTQVATPGDKRIETLMTVFEKAVYAELRITSKL